MKRMYPKENPIVKIKRICFAILFLSSLLGQDLFAQLDTEFWFAPPELTEALNPGTDGPRDRPIQLVISTLEKSARVEILKPADASFQPIIENIPANSTRIVNLTSFIDQLESKPENTVLNTGILIRSTQSISAYYEIKSQNNTDLFALKGLNANGKKFFVPFQTRWNNSLRKGPGGGFYNPETYASFDIVATDDSTFVTVTPKKDLVGHAANVPFTFMLNRGQVYSCRAIDRFGINHPAGSRIEATKEVAVTMKDDMLQFDVTEQVAGADIAGDQLIPVEYLGDNYVLVKGGLAANNDRAYILATEDNTIIRFNGSADAADTLDAGEQYELQMTKASYFLSTNGKKVAVLHISGLVDQLAGAMIPALTCTGTNRIGFTRTTSNTFIINVITKLSAIDKFTLNGDPTLVPASAFTAIQGGNGWAFARITLSTSQVPAGTTLLLKNSGNELFHLGVTNYAAGVGSNYGYFSNFSKLNLGTVKNVCTGDTALLDAGPAKTFYLWSTGDTTRTIETLIPGKYWVSTLSGSECPKSDTVTVRFYTPNFDLGPDDTICIGGSTLLTPDGVFTYQWQDGSTATSYLVTQPGTYWAQVADFQGCQTRDSIEILASPRPVTPIVSGGDTVCQGNSVALSMNLISNAFYAWLDPDSNVISGRNISVNTGTQPLGAYKGYIKVNGCESLFDTAIVAVTDPPPVRLGADTVLCFVNGSITLDPLQHQSGYQYLWNNGSSDSILTVSQSGIYSVRVTNAEGCSAFDTIQVTFQGPAGALTFTGGSQFCANQPAEFGVNEVQGTIYNWTGPNGFSFIGASISIPSIQANQAGSYSVTPVLNGCTGTTSEKVISVLAFPVVDLGPDTGACGSFIKILDPVKGSSGFSFLWSNGSIDSAIVVSTQGTYSVQVSNANCSASDTIQIKFGVGPDTVVFAGSRVYCEGENASFGVVPVAGESYSWTGPNGFTASGAQISIPNISQSLAGSYEVIPSLPGCPGTPFQISIQVNSKPVFPGMKDTSFCAGSSIVLDPLPNGNGETFYLWNNGSTDSSLTVSTAGSYSVILDNGLCQSFDTVLVGSRPKPASPLVSADTSVCPGASLSFSVQAVSGQTYSWSGPAGFTGTGSSVSLQNVGTSDFGTYFVNAILNNCVSDTSRVTLSQSPAPEIQLPDTASICDGEAVLLDPGNFGAGVSFLWSNGSTDSSLLVSQAGLITVSVSNGSCTSEGSTFVRTASSPSTLIITGNTNLCSGSDLNLSVQADNGALVSWTGPNGFSAIGNNINIPNAQVSQSGSYLVSQISLGCPGIGDTASVVVIQTPSSDLPASVTICNGNSLTLDPVAAGAGLSYLWSTGSTDSAIVVSSAGLVTVTVSNQICSLQDSVLVIESQSPSPLSISGPAQACEGSDVQLSVSSQPNVSISWTGPNGFTSTENSISLSSVQATQAGLYIVSQDLNGCPGTGDSLLLTVLPSPAPNLGNEVSICGGDQVLLDPGVNGSDLTYLWSTGSTDSAIVVSDAGIYSVTVSLGSCSAVDSILVLVNQPPSAVSISGPSEACEGSDVVLSSSASVGGVAYFWSGPAGFSSEGSSITLQNVQVLQSGDYILSQSLNGCEGNGDTLSLSINARPQIELGSPVAICSGINVVLDPVSVSEGLTFLWSNGSSDSSISVSQPGIYSVVVSNGFCSVEDSVLVTVGQTPELISISGNSEYCSGTDALISSNPGQGVSLIWSGPNGFTSTEANISLNNIQPIQSGLYIVNQTRDGCSGNADSILVTVLITPQAELGNNISVCDGNPVTLDPVSAGAGFTYLWNTGSTDSSLTVGQSGQYLVTVSNGDCQAIDSVSVLFGTTPAPLTISGTSTLCQGENLVLNTDALAETEVNWTGPASFSFTGANLILSDVQLNQAGLYIAVPSDNGCPGQADSITVIVNSSPQIELGPNLAVCNGSQVTLDPINGSQGLTFQWNTGSTDSLLVVSTAGVYTVVVSDGGICPATDSITVIDGVAPPAVSIAGDTLYCAGSTAIFALPELNQITYSWTGPNGFTSVSDTLIIPNVTASNAGVYTVIPSLGNCAGQPSSITLVLGPDLIVDLGSDDTICGPGPVVLNPMNSAPGFTYLWNVGATDSVILAAQSGLYSVTVRKQGCSKTDSVRLTFEALPATPTIVGNNTFCSGSDVELTLQGTEAGVEYRWTGPNGLNQTGLTLSLPGITIAASGEYQVTPVSGNCEGLPSVLLITVFQSPEANLGQDLTACEGNPLTLDPGTAGNGQTYLWSTGSTDSSIVVNSTGVYSVEVSNGSICIGRDTISVQYFIQPGAPLISGDFQYCEGENAQFGTSVPAGVSVSWTGPNGFSFQGNQVNIPGISVSQTGYYKALPFSPGCLGTADSVLISVSGNPSVELGADTTACAGNPLTIGVPNQAGLSYQWTGGATSSSISVSGSGVYYLTVSNAGQCSATDSITVTVKPAPSQVQVLRGSQTICSNETAYFKVQANGTEEYSWQGPAGFSATGDSIQVGSGISGGGNYEVKAGLNGCFGPAVSLELILRTVPVLSVSYDSLACNGKFKTASATATDGATLFWSNLTSAAETQLSVGTHWVTATLNGCSSADTFVVRNSGPSAAFTTFPSDSLLEVFKDVRFLDQSVAGVSPLVSWSWELGFATLSNEQNPVKRYDFEAPVDVILVVSDQAGCTDTLQKTLLIGAPRGWLIPNLFTPNGDNLNDKFEIRDLDKFPGSSIRIVSRWGKVEADISDYKNDWTGDGLDEGIYFYTVGRSDGQEFTGFVELKR